MSQHTTFEVHVQRDNGQWTIHETYQGHQREQAIEEAKVQLSERADFQAVKVVREVMNPDTGIFNDSVIYKAEAPKKPILKQTSQGGNPSAGDRAATMRQGGFARKRLGRKEELSLKSVFVRLLLVMLSSVLIAGLSGFGSAEFLGGTKTFGVRWVGRTETNLLIGVFILTFVICATGLTYTVMRNVKLKNRQQSRWAAWFAAWMQKTHQRNAAAKAAKMAAAAALARNSVGTIVAAGPSEQTMEMTGQQVEEEEASEPVQEQAPEPEPEAAPVEDGLSPSEEKLKVYMVDFLQTSLSGSQADQNNLDNFNRFGISMYMAGACEILSEKGKMAALSQSKILASAVQVLGFKKSHAASFADKYQEYLMADSRYMQMFQSGRNAINTYLSDETAGPGLLDTAITDWNKPKIREEQTGPITVLFTDIAGSTAMTQNLGDAGAQEVVRAHNRIVREALSAFAGKEIKHTGDGIMASFNKTSDGVDAAIQMQQETEKHNQQHPNLPLHLKIGLNAGEPIAEDNDLFGTMVQLSARIVDKASADEIFISEIIRGICAGKNYNFLNRGGFQMKGFDEDIVLYEVPWKTN
ncbi:MAG: adenylate/guanylate cyclase domain-containing protein [Rhodospirillales bacterium]|nr:adenylate/guanylate cyclase domain-containing protein [Rhodospirillales bacterium]